MPTSAATGTESVSTAGKTRRTAKKAATKTETESTLSSPDGAPIVTDPDEVRGGDRTDLAPSPPQTQDPAPLADPSGNGIVQVSRPDGSQVLLDGADPDLKARIEAIRSGERNH